MISHQALDEVEDSANCRFTSSCIEDRIAGLQEAIRLLVAELRSIAQCNHPPFPEIKGEFCNHCKKYI